MSALEGAAFRVHLSLPYDEALARTRQALKAEGFGVLTEIDVQATLKARLNQEFRKYVILGACNPPLAHQALSSELELGLFLPCNVIVYEDAGGSTVSIIDPQAMLGMVGSPALEPVAREAGVRLRRVAAALAG
jgi:uncharacterized protein (DUF302 family)